MAKLTIEIDTGTLAKLDGRGNRGERTVGELIQLVGEASMRLEKVGASADGVVLYGRGGPRGKITLVKCEITNPTQG
jgi:hypothetical protein